MNEKKKTAGKKQINENQTYERRKQTLEKYR